MSEELRIGRRKPHKYFIANKGSESEGESEEEFPGRRRFHSPPYHGTPSQHTTNGAHHPPILTTDFATRSSQDASSHPSLSSPSSASSQAADESTPPPATPGSIVLPPTSTPPVPIKPAQSTYEQMPFSDRHNSGDSLQSTSRSKHYMNPIVNRPPQRIPVDHSPARRPKTSPVVSTSEPQPSSSYTAPSSAKLNLEGLLICVATDSDPGRFNVVQLSGIQSAASIRRSILQESKVPDDEFAQYAIYRTEIGALAIGEPLSDDRLHELVRTQADSRGSLKFFVSRCAPKARDLTPTYPTSTTPLTIDQTLPPNVVGPLRLNKRHPSRSRQGSLSSVGSEQPAELGYDADGESQKPNHRQLPAHVSHSNTPPSPRRRPGQALPMQPPPLPHSVLNGQPPSPIAASSNQMYKPPTPPTTTTDRFLPPNTPLTAQTTTYTDKYGQVRPVPGPPPPLSPRRSDVSEESNLSPPFKAHIRAGSDAGADRDMLLKKTEQQMDSYAAQWRKEATPAMTFTSRPSMPPRDAPVPRRKYSVADDESSRDSWVIVNDAGYLPDPPPAIRDPPRASPTSLSRSPRNPSNTRYYPRGSAVSQSKAPASTNNSGSESRPSLGNRSGTKPLPINTVMVAWRAEEKKTKPSPVSKGLASKSMTKSMDNLRPSRPRTATASSFQPNRLNPQSGYQTPNAPAMPKPFDQSPRTIRPLPVQGYSHSSNSDFGVGSSSSISHVQQYPRSTAYPSSTTTPTFMQHTPEPFPRPQSAAESPIVSPTYHPRPLQSPTYGATLTPGESSRSPRAASPSRALMGPRPLPVHSDRSDRSSVHSVPDTTTSTPPRTPISPTSPQYSTSEKTTYIVEPSSPSNDNGTYISSNHSSELTLRQGDNEKFAQLLSSLNANAVMSRDNLNSSQSNISDSIAFDDNSSDEGGGGTWQIPLRRPPSARPELTPLQTDLDSSKSTSSSSSTRVPQVDSSQQQYQQGQAGLSQSASSASSRPMGPQYRPQSSRRPTESSANNHHHRVSTFAGDRDGDWAPRPLPDDVYERLEDFFPDHDLDRPFIEANSGGNSPTNPEPVAPLPPPPSTESAAEMDTMYHHHPRRSTKKSIRVVVAEQQKKKGDGRMSRADLAQSATAALRKRNTKMWGSRLEEVDTRKWGNRSDLDASQSRATSSTIPESPSGGPTTFKWVRGELIGKGTYGRVYLALNATTGEMIAVKQVELPQTPSDKNDNRQATVVQALKMESETLKDLDHPHIVQYLGFEETPTNLSIFLEYVPGGSIGSVLHKHGKFDEYVVRSFTWQILDGLEYLHSKGILHRDLKADNILVEMTGICKISDFGISKRTDDIYGGAFTAMQGTVFWMAPEVINTQKGGYNFKIDIWSVGCVVLEMWGGRRPWTGQEMIAVMFKLYQAKLPPPVPDDVTLSELADDFRLKCFAINPDERPSAAELKRHRYLVLPPEWHFTSFTSSLLD